MPITQTPINAEVGAATSEGRRPTVAAPALASPELTTRPHRRIFTAQDKMRILADTDRAADTGGIAAILRREDLYSSALTGLGTGNATQRFRRPGAGQPARGGPEFISTTGAAVEMAAEGWRRGRRYGTAASRQG